MQFIQKYHYHFKLIKSILFLGCCIYRKPLSFGESSSEDDEDCENCFGHPEKRLKNQQRRKRNDTAANSNEQVDDKYDVSNHEDVSAVNVMHQ